MLHLICLSLHNPAMVEGPQTFTASLAINLPQVQNVYLMPETIVTRQLMFSLHLSVATMLYLGGEHRNSGCYQQPMHALALDMLQTLHVSQTLNFYFHLQKEPNIFCSGIKLCCADKPIVNVIQR